MKDVEFVGLLLLLLEEGPKGYSQDTLDQAFTDRDADWEDRQNIETAFRRAIGTITEILAHPPNEGVLDTSRLRNQADFYSLFGAIAANQQADSLVDSAQAAQRLLQFVQDVEDETGRGTDPTLQEYYEAARSASKRSRASRDSNTNSFCHPECRSVIVPASVLQKHEYVRPYLNELGQYVRDVVAGYCDRTGYAYAGRVKSSESLAEKIETGRYRQVE